MSQIKITSLGIKRALNSFNPEEAVTEYIWNGFDAGATSIDINITYDKPFNNVVSMTIIDNGSGIEFDLLENKFVPFLESEKSLKRKEENVSVQGKNGYGRLTFFKFAQKATWGTTYIKEGQSFDYEIIINSDTLDKYKNSKPLRSSSNFKHGTKVSFKNLTADFHKDYIETKLANYLRNEFGWFLEVNASKGFKITIDDIKLTYEDLIADKDDFAITISIDDKEEEFYCKYVQWSNKLNDEFSRFYFLNEENKLKYQRTTKLNRKGDQFYHSIIVRSKFFENFNYFDDEEEKTQQIKLFTQTSSYRIFKQLLDQLNLYLKKKRKPFLHSYANTLIKTYEEEKVMPTFGNNTWDRIKKNEFETLVKELYEVEPALFIKLNTEQKKTFLHLLNLLLDSDERENLFNILAGIIDLDQDEKQDLEKILKSTKLNNIIKSVKLVQDRIIVIEKIKELVFDHELKANERDHLQKVIEQHYWIFGEEFNLVCAAETKFEKALRKYLYILRGETKSTSIKHVSKNKEMDIFLVRQNYSPDAINNIIVELKSPTTVRKLSKKELNQVKEYFDVILSTDEFNAFSNSTWEFYLIGQDYDETIEREIENSKNHGEKSLAFKVDNYKIFVKKWSEIFIDVALRLNWLNDKLQIEREKLTDQGRSANEILKTISKSSALMPKEVQLLIK